MKIYTVPWLNGFLALTLHPKVILVTKRFHKLRIARQEVTIEHERVHVAQQLYYGWFKFMWMYIFTGKRAELEVKAYRVDLDYYVAGGRNRYTTAEAIVNSVLKRYFPKYWFGKPPNKDKLLEILLET